MSVFTALCGGLVGFVLAAFYLLSHFSNRVRLSARAGLYMWILLFGSVAAMLVGFVDLAKLAINTPLSGGAPTPTSRPVAARPSSTHAPRVATPTLSGPACTKWDKVTASMNGKTICVYGVVTDHVENFDAQQTFFYFGGRDKFFFTSLDRWTFSEDACVSATGKIELNTYKTPYMKVGQIGDCP